MALTLDFSTSPSGSIFVEDDGILNSIGQVRHGSGGFPTATFAYPADTLTVLYRAGQLAYLNLIDPTLTCDVTLGDPAGTSKSPDDIRVRQLRTVGNVTLSSRGTITEWGDDAEADIVANSATLRTGSGAIGTATNALETQVFKLEAFAVDGGINLRNYSSVAIGGTSSSLAGIHGEVGNIRLEVYGSITAIDTSFSSPTIQTLVGDITVNAIGANADFTSLVSRSAIAADGGSINLNAGSDVLLGVGGVLGNHVTADRNVAINASGMVSIDGGSHVIADSFDHSTGGDLTITAGGGIAITKNSADFAYAAALGAGDVTLTAGIGSALVLETFGAALFASSGNITVNADRVEIAANSFIQALSGQVVIRPQAVGRAIDLGSWVESGGLLTLSDAELDNISAESLVLGSLNAGTVTVVSSLTPANVTDVTIESGGDILFAPGADMATKGDLTLRAGGDIRLGAGFTLTTGGLFTGYVDVGNADPGEGGSAVVDASLAAAVRFFGGSDADSLTGGAGADWLDGAGGGDTMRGRAGNDTYAVNHAGDTTIEVAGEGTDTVRASLSWILAANLEVLTLLGSGNINGTGNTIANSVTGNSGANSLSGLAGNDTLLGNAGNDALLGGDGNDLLNGGAGNDTLNGGNHIDTASYAGASAAVSVALVAGAQATGGSGSDTLIAVENLEGSSFADTLTGNNAANALNGGNGNDVLRGLAGNDTLLGGIGADRLVGGAGLDIMTGGANADLFDFDAVSETGIAPSTRDQIEDFAQGSDKIDLSTIDANTLVAGNQAFTFIGDANFGGVAGQLRATRGMAIAMVQGDVNGDGVRDFEIQLNTGWTLTAADFAL
jgi:Ca2+-binding RTX toxin-like protein